MSGNSTVDILFKEHSFEEIESVRDNLASEIEKRTELLKSKVKEKFKDILDTSEAIKSMKINLKQFQHSIQHLDSSISEFHTKIKETNQTRRHVGIFETANTEGNNICNDKKESSVYSTKLRSLLLMSNEVWDHFEAGDLKSSVGIHNECKRLLKLLSSPESTQKDVKMIKDLELRLERDYDMIKNHIWFKVQSAEPNQIGIIAGCDEQDLYSLSLQISIDVLADKLHREISDTSYQAQIRRHEQYLYFNTTTNAIDSDASDLKPPSLADHVQIPQFISTELSEFLFETCRVINTIAGFSLSRHSIIGSLKMVLDRILVVYSDLVSIVDTLNAGSKRRRALQLYFDLMYIRVLLNTAKDLELIEELDPQIFALMRKFEVMLDSIELYIVSDALHTSVLNLSKSTIRLYGLLVPYLQ